MHTLKIALDWTPNINHIGFFVAQAKGFYQQVDLDVQIWNPAMDNYAITPAKKVELGEMDIALCPMESVISYRTKTKAFPMVAIAAVLQEDLSAIVVRADAGITSPKDLDGKIYASYAARYEDEIVRSMVQNDGGKGALQLAYPKKLGIWDTLLSGECDATWIFLNWEAVAAAKQQQKLRYFKMADYDVPYSYSPVLAASEEKVNAHADSIQNFLEATKSGYLFAQSHSKEVVEILKPHVPEYDQHIDLEKALALSASAFGTAASWGRMKSENVQQFLDWLKSKELETASLSWNDLVRQ